MTGNSKIHKAIEDLKAGKFILIYDADGREEETDFVISSAFITPDSIRTMRLDGGGLICTTIDHDTRTKLGLPYLSEVFWEMGEKFNVLKNLIPNDIPYDEISSFSVTINHRNTFTGITDNDRALTISEFSKLITAINKLENGNAQKLFGEQFRAPGHVHLLNSSKNILTSRRGHTELATAIMIMADLVPSATICEMMAASGKARSKEDARQYANDHGLVFLEGYEVIEAWEKWPKKVVQ
jgi:3,4-dihydroxy 2-butanone 4-phosphate synthase